MIFLIYLQVLRDIDSLIRTKNPPRRARASGGGPYQDRRPRSGDKLPCSAPALHDCHQSRPPPAHAGSHGDVHSVVKARMCKGALILEQLGFIHFSVGYFSSSSSNDK